MNSRKNWLTLLKIQNHICESTAEIPYFSQSVIFWKHCCCVLAAGWLFREIGILIPSKWYRAQQCKHFTRILRLKIDMCEPWAQCASKNYIIHLISHSRSKITSPTFHSRVFCDDAAGERKVVMWVWGKAPNVGRFYFDTHRKHGLHGGFKSNS